MIEVSLREIVESIPTFQEISQKEINIRTSFKIARIMQALETEYKTFGEMRDAMLQKYGETDEIGQLKVTDDGNFSIKQDCIAAFNTDIANLLSTTVQLNVSPISLNELEELTITPSKALSITAFIEE